MNNPPAHLSNTMYGLKIIAVFMMLLDHTAYMLDGWSTVGIMGVLHTLGRISIPVFAALLVLNILYFTRDQNNYLVRLLALGVISEPIYYWFFHLQFNPFLALAFGMVLLCLLPNSLNPTKNSNPLFVVLLCLTLFAYNYLAPFTLVYVNLEIALLVVSLYMLFKGVEIAKDRFLWRSVWLGIAFWLMFALNGLNTFWLTGISIALILVSSCLLKESLLPRFICDMGRLNSRLFYYLFYPAHLLGLLLIHAFLTAA